MAELPPRASLLGIPLELRCQIINELLQLSKDEYYMPCCPEHHGDTWLEHEDSNDEEESDYYDDTDDPEVSDTSDDDRKHAAAERPVKEKALWQRCVHVARLSQTCRQLSAEARDCLYATIAMNFCIKSYTDSISFGRTLFAYPSHPNLDWRGNAASFGRTTSSLRIAQVLIELEDSSAESAWDLLSLYEHFNQMSALMRCFADSTVLRKLRLIIRKKRDHGERLHANWDTFYDQQIKQYLQTVHAIPDQVCIAIVFEDVYEGNLYRDAAIVTPFEFNPATVTGQYIQDLMSKRSEKVKIVNTLLSEYLRFECGLSGVDSFLKDPTVDKESHALGQSSLMKLLSDVWTAHFAGDRSRFIAAKEEVRQLWEVWVQKAESNFMDT